LPNRISSYQRTLDIKTVTDKTAAEAITRFGLERKLQLWEKPKPVFKKLQQLTRERDQLIQTRTLIKNQLHAEQAQRQLASYAGFDVKEKQSGTSVKGKPRISKRGNRHLRKAMHFPALGAIRRDERFKAIFARLVSKHGIKMKAVVAVQRRLLEMIYVLYKTGGTYDENYLRRFEGTDSQNIENEPIAVKN
jgi:transposase